MTKMYCYTSLLAARETDTGARNIENILARSVLPELAAECLAKMANGENISKIHISVNGEGQFSYEIA